MAIMKMMSQYTQKHDKNDVQRLEATMAHIAEHIDFEGAMAAPLCCVPAGYTVLAYRPAGIAEHCLCPG